MIKQFVISILLSAAFVQGGQAQDAASITRDIESLRSSSGVDEGTRTTAIDILTQAKQAVSAASERAASLRGFETTAASAAATIAQLNDELTALGQQTSIPQSSEMSDRELNVALSDLVAERASLMEALGSLRSRQTDLSARSDAIATQVAQARSDVVELQDTPPSNDPTSDPIEEASRTLYAARLAERRAAIEDWSRERATLGPRQEVVEARIAFSDARVEQLSRTIKQLQDLLGSSRTATALSWVSDTTKQLASISKNHVDLVAFATENVDLARTNLDLVESTIAIKTETNRLQLELADITASAQTVDQVLATGQLNEETAELLRNVRTRLPNGQQLAQLTNVADQTAVALRLNIILWQDQLRNLSDSEESIIAKLSSVTAQNSSSDIASLSENLVYQRREYLQALIAAAREKSNEIVAQRSVRQTMLERTSALAGLLDRRLLWLSTKSGFSTASWENISKNVSWLVSIEGWRDTSQALVASFRALNIVPVALALLAGVFALLAKGIRHRLLTLAARVGDVRKDTYLTTPAALALSFLHTLPLPLAIFAVGLAIEQSATMRFSDAIAQGLYAMGAVGTILGVFRTLTRESGVFHRHFGWSETARFKLRKLLSWFIIVQASVAFIFTAAVASGDPIVKYGVGRLAFMVSSITIALFAFQVLKPHGGIAMSISDDRKFTGTMRFLLVLLVAAPLITGFLPAVGYFDAAIELQTRVFQSGIVILLAAIIYRLSMRLFLVGHRRLALKCAEEKRARKKVERQESAESDQSGDAAPVIKADQALDLDTLSHQSRRAVLAISLSVLIIGLWATWSALLPALGIVNDVILWNGIRQVDGIAVSTGISLWDLTVALIFIFGGFVVARNVSGILEVVVFERLSMDTGSRYATITIGKYVLVTLGVVIGLNRLGLDWSSLQWVIAALGVGLGFGLQEIVANFVSGLIILFERPVRVGDIVTIGQLEGTVTSIKIRATRITDFDNREVLMPNKSIITENVTNWTLNDQVTRIIIRIGVAYGSDIDQVREIILNAVQSHSDTLQTPSPVVLFMAHGDSSLDFEARVFVATPSKRLPVTHDLNRSINLALAKNDIEIPFPQRDLHIKGAASASDGVLD